MIQDVAVVIGRTRKAVSVAGVVGVVEMYSQVHSEIHVLDQRMFCCSAVVEGKDAPLNPRGVEQGASRPSLPALKRQARAKIRGPVTSLHSTNHVHLLSALGRSLILI